MISIKGTYRSSLLQILLPKHSNIDHKYSKMKFTTTERGNRKLIRDGYLYVFKKILPNDVSSSECILSRTSAQYKASIKLSNPRQIYWSEY